MAGGSIFDGCDESCGWMAAVLAVLAWGSFGVPIKFSAAQTANIEVHPLVMQTYKTIVCFATCWMVIFLGERPLRWTNWGILSGLFWVPGATAGIYGIKHAGLAVSVGTWSSIGVLTSFFFGIIVFKEGVKHFVPACMAFGCLIVGLIGMARYSAASSSPPLPASSSFLSTSEHNIAAAAYVSVDSNLTRPRSNSKPPKSNHDKRGASLGEGTTAASEKPNKLVPLEMEPLVVNDDPDAIDDEAIVMGTGGGGSNKKNQRAKKKSLVTDPSNYDNDVTKKPKDIIMISLFGGIRFSITRHQSGVLGAFINGAWGSLNLIPFHYAKKQSNGTLSGAAYLVSFGGGAMIVLVAMWTLLFLYYLIFQNQQRRWNVAEALDCLPKMHWNELGYSGTLAGLLYATGNFMSIIAVTYLGQGTGYSFTQMQLFVSGLWGVFYFKEIKGTDIILKWFASALVAIFGIVWLSYEHEGSSGGGHRLRRFLTLSMNMDDNDDHDNLYNQECSFLAF